MSRTYKIHTHKAPRDRRLEASNRGMKSRYRSAVRAALRGVRDLSEADDFYCDPMDFHTLGKSSSSHLWYGAVEATIFKELVSLKKALLNGSMIARLDMYGPLDKLIIDTAIRKDTSFTPLVRGAAYTADHSQFVQMHARYSQLHERYLRKGLRELSDAELKALVHKFVASKGGR